MATSIRISSLGVLSSIKDSDFFPIVQSSSALLLTTYRTPISSINSFIAISGSVISSSYSSASLSASYAKLSDSASYLYPTFVYAATSSVSITSSYSKFSATASLSNNSISASYAKLSDSASYLYPTILYKTTSSWSQNSLNSNFSISSSWASQSLSASHALNSDNSITASFAKTTPAPPISIKAFANFTSVNRSSDSTQVVQISYKYNVNTIVPENNVASNRYYDVTFSQPINNYAVLLTYNAYEAEGATPYVYEYVTTVQSSTGFTIYLKTTNGDASWNTYDDEVHPISFVVFAP